MSVSHGFGSSCVQFLLDWIEMDSTGADPSGLNAIYLNSVAVFANTSLDWLRSDWIPWIGSDGIGCHWNGCQYIESHQAGSHRMGALGLDLTGLELGATHGLWMT